MKGREKKAEGRGEGYQVTLENGRVLGKDRGERKTM